MAKGSLINKSGKVAVWMVNSYYCRKETLIQHNSLIKFFTDRPKSVKKCEYPNACDDCRILNKLKDFYIL